MMTSFAGGWLLVIDSLCVFTSYLRPATILIGLSFFRMGLVKIQQSVAEVKVCA